MNMKQIKGGVTAAKGYEAASTAAGIKYKGRTDMAMIYSQVPCVAAGTFTTNVVKAAPVKWDQQVVKSGAKVQAVIVNSGIANACTGAEGFGYCKDTAVAAAKALNISEDGVLIGSTGVIGKQMPINRLVAGIDALAGKKNDTLENGTEAAKAIMTTDTCEKEKKSELYTDMICLIKEIADHVIPKENEARKGMDDIMGGKVLTLPSDLIRQGREEGLSQGRLNEIFSSVQDGDYPISRGAQKAEMSIEHFEKAMIEAGYKLPANV